MSYVDVATAKKWWITAFDCEEVAVPPDWDDTLTSDVALKFSGDDEPTILLGSSAEGRERADHPVVFTGKLAKAHQHFQKRGIVVGPVHEEYGTPLFTVSDPEGNSIEICEEP